jgi:hypothetical protein
MVDVAFSTWYATVTQNDLSGLEVTKQPSFHEVFSCGALATVQPVAVFGPLEGR